MYIILYGAFEVFLGVGVDGMERCNSKKFERVMDTLGTLNGRWTPTNYALEIFTYRYNTWCFVQDILPETNIAPVNGWLEDDPFLFGVLCLFSGGELFVFGEIFSPFKLWLFRAFDI